jgi:hypothetical protein
MEVPTPANQVASEGAVLSEETQITEITIQPDGRVYVFGTSRQVLEVLEQLRPDDPRLQRLLSHVRGIESSPPPPATEL